MVGESEGLLVRGNALLVLYHTLDHADGVNSTCNTNSSAAVGRQHAGLRCSSPSDVLSIFLTRSRRAAASACDSASVDAAADSSRKTKSVMVLPFSLLLESSFIARPVSSCCFLIFLALTCSRLFIITLTATLYFVFRISVEINVTASFNQRLRNGRMPFVGREEERRGSTRILVIDQGLRACRRQKRPNSHCVAITLVRSHHAGAKQACGANHFLRLGTNQIFFSLCRLLKITMTSPTKSFVTRF